MFPWDQLVISKSIREKLEAMTEWPEVHTEIIVPEKLERIQWFLDETGTVLNLITDRKGKIEGAFIGGVDEAVFASWTGIHPTKGRTLQGLRWLIFGIGLDVDGDLEIRERYVAARYGLDLVVKADLESNRASIFYPEVKKGRLSKAFDQEDGYTVENLLTIHPNRQVQQLESLLKEDITHVVGDEKEKALLIGLDLPARSRKGLYSVKESLAEVMGQVVQSLDAPHSTYYLGAGKASELKYRIYLENIDLVIFDDELSPAQQRNLEELLLVKIVDRSRLILDIFAQHARTREGKLQVELAQLKYMLPRLSGMGQQLSRLGGGIGTRGPGETKLEADRQRLRKRIHDLEVEIQSVAELRELHHQGRKLPVVALVGYTNAGKSTLLNRLTQAGVLAENKLFATLDPTMRKLELGSSAVLLSDTVGFIQKLPHHLIAAFRATLEEVQRADLLLHVVDASHSERELQMQTVLDVLGDLEVLNKPIITVFNKSDLIEENDAQYLRERFRPSAPVSALTGQGLPEFLDLIRTEVEQSFRELAVMLPYNQGSWVERLHKTASVLREEYENEGIYLEVKVEPALAGQLEQYIVNPKTE
jgi:GTP-binding protein HflX